KELRDELGLVVLFQQEERSVKPSSANTLAPGLEMPPHAAARLVGWTNPGHIWCMKKIPFRLTPYQVQFLLVVGFVTVGYALYLRYLAIDFSALSLACDAGLPT